MVNWYDKAAKDGFKYFYAQRINGGEWVIKAVAKIVKPIDESRMFGSCPIGEMSQSEFAIFRAGRGWEIKRPFRVLDCRDRSNAPIPAAIGMWLVNQADAGYF